MEVVMLVILQVLVAEIGWAGAGQWRRVPSLECFCCPVATGERNVVGSP